MFLFRVSDSSISHIVPEVCAALIEGLKEYIKVCYRLFFNIYVWNIYIYIYYMFVQYMVNNENSKTDATSSASVKVFETGDLSADCV